MVFLPEPGVLRSRTSPQVLAGRIANGEDVLFALSSGELLSQLSGECKALLERSSATGSAVSALVDLQLHRLLPEEAAPTWLELQFIGIWDDPKECVTALFAEEYLPKDQEKRQAIYRRSSQILEIREHAFGDGRVAVLAEKIPGLAASLALPMWAIEAKLPTFNF